MNYKVCILAAGKGTRNKYAEKSNKALLPLGNEIVLSYLIRQFPADTEIVIPVGYNADMIRGFVRPWGKRITCVDVEYEGKGVGPGYSLLQCRGVLSCPFVYMACDTIVANTIPPPTYNWIGVSHVTEKLPYLTVNNKSMMVKEVYDKGDESATYLASIGLVGVKDYVDFWEGLAHPPRLVQNEHQDTSGLNALIKNSLFTEHFTWFDIGNTEDYEYSNRYFASIIP